jgi:hypothetical protein
LEGPQGALVWPDYLEADDVDTLTVEGEGLEGLRFELWWSRDGSFSPERSIAPAGEPADPRAVRFDMASAPQWSGSIRRFRLTWSGATSRSSRVLRAWGAKRVSPAATDPS